MTANSGWIERRVCGDDCRLPESGELAKRFGVEWQLSFLADELYVVSIREVPHVSEKLVKSQSNVVVQQMSWLPDWIERVGF